MTRGAEEVRIGGWVVPSWKAGFASGASIAAICWALAVIVLRVYGMADIGFVAVAAPAILLGSRIMWASHDQR